MNTFQQLFNLDFGKPPVIDTFMQNGDEHIGHWLVGVNSKGMLTVMWDGSDPFVPDMILATGEFIQRIIVNGDATIVFWKDDTKTVVKRSPDTEYSLYNAVTAALAIKLFGSNSKLQKVIERKTVIQNRKHGKKVAKSEPDGWGCLTARFKLGDRVVLANPDQEDEATKALFADNNLVVVPKTIDGKVTVLAGHMDGLKRFDIEPERLALYDRT